MNRWTVKGRIVTHLICDECETVYSELAPVPWTLRNTEAMHKRGTGHTMTRVFADDWSDEDMP